MNFLGLHLEWEPLIELQYFGFEQKVVFGLYQAVFGLSGFAAGGGVVDGV